MKIGTFLREVKVEMAKVTWPTKSQMISYTVVVIGISVAIAIYLGLLDAAFKALLDKIILK